MAWTRRGGMYYAPLSQDPVASMPNLVRGQRATRIGVGEFVGGEWRHFPINTYWDAFKGGNLATNVAWGNFKTRNYRQKGFLNSPLEVATHTKKPTKKELRNKVLKKIDNRLVIPTVSQRRVKDYPKNKVLSTSTRMPYKKATTAKKYTKKPYKASTNRKSTNNKKPTKPKTVTKVLAKQVKELQKAVKVDKASHTWKSAETGRVLSLVGRCTHVNFNCINKTVLETASANLRYYDPAVPGTLVTADANTGTYSRDVHFKNAFVKMMLRNNYQVPARVKVYLCKVKLDNNDANGPLTVYTTAITDQVINAGTDETDALIHVNDIERVKEVWNIDCVIDKVLEPGQEASTSHTETAINFDPAHIDDYSNAYQKAFKSFTYLIRVEGVLGHDTTAADQQTLLAAGIDYQVTRKIVIEYDAGVQLDDIYIYEQRPQAFTNGGVVSLKPIADNIAYSVS